MSPNRLCNHLKFLIHPLRHRDVVLLALLVLRNSKRSQYLYLQHSYEFDIRITGNVLNNTRCVNGISFQLALQEITVEYPKHQAVTGIMKLTNSLSASFSFKSSNTSRWARAFSLKARTRCKIVKYNCSNFAHKS